MFDTLRADFKAIFERDPAARSPLGWLEVILTYAGFHALLSHRVCHRLYLWKIPFFPRMFSQLTRFLTGVEIHPGAQIGKGFFIDHGTGVVIGETTIIGNDVTIYQGVTLGGTGKERGKRHPTVGNGVVIGCGAIVLGNIKIGDHARIGAGSVVVDPVPANSTVVGVPAELVRREGKRVQSINLDHADLPHPVQDSLALIQKEIKTLEQKLAEYRSHTRQKASRDSSML